MYQRVTRIVVPSAAVVAVTATGTMAWAGDAAHPGRAPLSTPCPADAVPYASAATSASPARNDPALRLALTAHAARVPSGDLVEYRITARSSGAPLRGVTVTARLTCAPGDVVLAGRPSASAGRATAGPRAVTWRLDLGRRPATAAFAVRVRPGERGGPLMGEVNATGSVSNCSATRAADTPADPSCTVTVVVPAGDTDPAHPAPAVPAPAASARPRPRPPGTRPAAPPSPPSAVPPSVPVLPPTPPMAPAPSAVGALPVVPRTGPSPYASPTVLSQLDRAPVVPAPATPGVAAQDVVPPETSLRSADSSSADLGGRALAFLIGGVAFLLLAAAIAGSVIGAQLRRTGPDQDEAAGFGRRPVRPRVPGRRDAHPRALAPPPTLTGVVRPPVRTGAARAGERPGRTAVDE